MMACILDHKQDGSAFRMNEKYIKSQNGQMKLRQITVGWTFLVRINDANKSWTPLRVPKEANLIDVAKYVLARKINNYPAFAWCPPYTLRKQYVVVLSINSRVKKRTHKYGIEIPTSHKDAIRLDTLNGNTLWADSCKLEMSNVGVAFEILKPGDKSPPGWKKESGHLIYDVKMDFTRKTRWVKDGHRTPNPKTSCYAGVIYCESILIALTYAALHKIDFKAADIQNAYLQSPSSEKHFIYCGEQFGLEHSGSVALIRRALYGVKAAGRDFWHHLHSCMEHLHFKSIRADPNVWIRP